MDNKIYKKIRESARVPESRPTPMRWEDLTPEYRQRALENNREIIDDIAKNAAHMALYDHKYGIQRLKLENFSYNIEDVTSPDKIDLSWDADISMVIEADLDYEIPKIDNLNYYVKVKFNKGNEDPEIDGIFLGSGPSFETIDNNYLLEKYYKNLYNQLESANASENVLSEVEDLGDNSYEIWDEFCTKAYTFANKVSKEIIDYIDGQINKYMFNNFIKYQEYTYRGDFVESKSKDSWV